MLFFILGYFLLFALLPPNSLKIENFKKIKTIPRDSIILHKFTNMMCDRCNCYFSFWTIFSLFTTLRAKKKKKKEKNEKNACRYHYFTQQVYQKSWSYTVPEIWHVIEIIIFHLGLFFALLLSNSPKKWKFQKHEKAPGDIIILQMCTKNHDHTLYCSWDSATDRCTFYFSFWVIFALLPKNEKFRKIKTMPGDIIILHKCKKNHDHTLYCSWDMAPYRCNCYFSFWTIFSPFTTLTA